MGGMQRVAPVRLRRQIERKTACREHRGVFVLVGGLGFSAYKSTTVLSRPSELIRNRWHRGEARIYVWGEA